MTDTDKLDQKVRAGLKQMFPGSEIVTMQRQARWRPAWDITIKIDGDLKKINVRGEKGDNYIGPLSLKEEAEIHHVLERHNIPAPHVYGMLDEPIATVMAIIPGQINLSTARDDAARASIRSQYVKALAALHDIPVQEFADIGLNVPEGAEAIALNLYGPCEKIYRDSMAGRPFALMDFIWDWVKTNVPKHRNRKAFITADSGQFLFEGDQLTGLIDFEVGYIGDPLAEFAGMRLRDSTEPLGDIGGLMDDYEALTGDKLDKFSVEYHTAGFCGINGFLLWPLAYAPGRHDDYVAYLSFSVGTSRWAISAIAEAIGVELKPVPEPTEQPITFNAAYQHLATAFEDFDVPDRDNDYHYGKSVCLARYLDRMNRYGGAIMQANLDDASALIGRPLKNADAAEIALVDFIKHATPADYPALVQYFHRWLNRHDFILKDCGSSAWLTNTDLQYIKPRKHD